MKFYFDQKYRQVHCNSALDCFLLYEHELHLQWLRKEATTADHRFKRQVVS